VGSAVLLEDLVYALSNPGKIIPRVVHFLEVYSVFPGFSGEDWKLLLMKEEYTDFIEPD
jgi:hypothetical protein